MSTRYHAEHTWVRIDGDTALVGITPHAQDTLGDIVFVDFPDIGQHFAQGSVAGVVESVKAAADVHMPASGEVLEVNEALRADPSLANSDPEDAGWFYRVKLTHPAELDGLMDLAAYQALIG
ncbi:MAG: glycine cleavage system protein [Pseudomonadota bacterium]|jgi:glycine cleavage system H protein